MVSQVKVKVKEQPIPEAERFRLSGYNYFPGNIFALSSPFSPLQNIRLDESSRFVSREQKYCGQIQDRRASFSCRSSACSDSETG